MSLRSISALRRVLLTALAAIFLAWPSLGARQARPLLKLSALLGKPLSEVEAVLGKPRHQGKEQERYYKVAGFVRVVAWAAPELGLTKIVFQFAPGTVKSELEALARVGVKEALLPAPWTSRWSAPGDSQNDELTLTREAPSAEPSAKPTGSSHVVLTKHFRERMQERGVSEAQAQDVLQNGQRFYDPKNDSYIRWKDGIYIAHTREGVLKTVVRGPIPARWKPL
jgi:Domain of unknown function (DUF4258)